LGVPGDRNTVKKRVDCGLSTEQAGRLLLKYGPNEINEKKQGFIAKFIKWFISPIALMLLLAALLSLASRKVFDFYFITSLMLFNFAIAAWHEHKADSAISKLKDMLAISVKVFRDGSWQWFDSRQLVPGDLVEMVSGELVAADMRILQAKNLTINESVLTGESFPKDKAVNDTAYSGSFVATGWVHAVVTATGSSTYFGKTLNIVETAHKRSTLEQDIRGISKVLMAISFVAVAALTTVFFIEKASVHDILILDLSLIIAGIPISLPTVMTLISSIGVVELSKKNAIVRRLSALEDLANVNLLLSDKTGTLTKNQISVEKVKSYGRFSSDEVLSFAAIPANQHDHDRINAAIVSKAKSRCLVDSFPVIEFIPTDSIRKRASASVRTRRGSLLVSTGAPQVIKELCRLSPAASRAFDRDVQVVARRGYRALAVAVKRKSLVEKQMELAGLIVLADPLEPDSKGIIRFLKSQMISVKMLTGDNFAISKRIASELALKGEVVKKAMLKTVLASASRLRKVAVFAEILPEDKYKIVLEAKKNNVVAVTGDGVNDLPAIKAADVGIAVKNSVDALKGTADVVLLSSGLSVIKDAIIESRKIFVRLYNYSVYRLSESFRLIVTVTVLGLLFRAYPLTPVQLILLALLNDLPIVSLAFDRVKYAMRPQKINVKERMVLSVLFGVAGIANSLLMFLILTKWLHESWGAIQTLYFLKLTISGHMLIYVAHTRERWFRFLPSKQVIVATTLTQLAATAFALIGIFMQRVPLLMVAFIWLWAFAWMQVSELMKDVQKWFVTS